MTNSRLELTVDDIHLWLSYYDEIADEALLAEYHRLLNDKEREQQPRFYFERDRRRYLVTRALVRTVLSRYADVQPKDWRFATNEYGRPEIANAGVQSMALCFNISHTHSAIVLGVTRGRALGVDVENIISRTAPLGIADRFFAPSEVRALEQVPHDEQPYRFFEYWTFKESYIKARGMGLSLGLDKFSFQFPHPLGVSLDTDPELEDPPARWQLWQLQPKPEYLLAVCAERLGESAGQLLVRRVVPLRDEELIAHRTLRVSDQLDRSFGTVPET